MIEITSAKQAIFFYDQCDILIDRYLEGKGWKAIYQPSSEPYPPYVLYSKDGQKFFSQRNALYEEEQCETQPKKL